MFFKISDPNARSLIEVEVTLHPGAIRDALTARTGCLWGMVWLAGYLALLYLSLGYELASHRFFPELGFHPVPLMLAYLALRGGMAVPMALSLVCGLLLDSGWRMPLGVNALILVLSTSAVALVSHEIKGFPWRKGWLASALAGGLGNLIFTLCREFVIWENLSRILLTVGVSTLLAAVAYMPAISATFDFVKGGRRYRNIPMAIDPEPQDSGGSGA